MSASLGRSGRRALVWGAVAAAGMAAATGAAAQVANPAPQAIGMGGNYTAHARGVAAVAWNPAVLAMPGNPGASAVVLPLAFTMGLDPVAPADFARYDGQIIPEEAKREWVERIRREGGERGSFAAEGTYLGVSVGRVALQASSTVRGRVNVGPDVAEVLLFGNAGMTGDPRDYTLDGSNVDVAGTTTFAASTALPLSLRLGPLPDQHFAVGVTLKYTIGNFLLMGQEDGSVVRQDPLEVHVRFPVIHSVLPGDEAGFALGDLDNGSGFGLDVGAAWQGGIFSAGATIQNLVSTFDWAPAALQYREGTATWTADTSYTSFEEMPVTEAPAELLDRIDDLYTFSPVLAAGAAARVLPILTVTGEVRHALKDDLSLAAQSHVGVGAELRAVPFVPLRAGLSLISGGYQLAGGFGLRLAGFELAASGALREGEHGADAVLGVGMTFGLR